VISISAAKVCGSAAGRDVFAKRLNAAAWVAVLEPPGVESLRLKLEKPLRDAFA
jgi:hypothetical protein